jgi:hypothetical protein
MESNTAVVMAFLAVSAKFLGYRSLALINDE